MVKSSVFVLTDLERDTRYVGIPIRIQGVSLRIMAIAILETINQSFDLCAFVWHIGIAN